MMPLPAYLGIQCFALFITDGILALATWMPSSATAHDNNIGLAPAFFAVGIMFLVSLILLLGVALAHATPEEQ